MAVARSTFLGRWARRAACRRSKVVDGEGGLSSSSAGEAALRPRSSRSFCALGGERALGERGFRLIGGGV